MTTERKLCVVGAGTMGNGIAAALALSGHRVALCDKDPGALEKARAKIEKNTAKGVELGKVDADVATAALARLTMTTELAEAGAGVDGAIEAVSESILLKRIIFAELEKVAAPGALMATNTSSLSIAAIAESLAAPQRLVGMHFFNPVHIMKLVEVVHHVGSDPEAVQEAKALAVEMGKTPIVVRDSPGFASSRLGLVIGLEAMRMLESEVASAHDIDTAMKLGYGHPMGPLELTDLVGLDVRLAIAEYLTTEVGPAFTPPAILREHVGAGRLGQKTGSGFFEWDGRKKKTD